MPDEKSIILVYVDGAVSMKEQKGGIGVIMVKEGENDHFFEFSSKFSYPDVTNNQMELQAIICAFNQIICKFIGDFHNIKKFVFCSDSAYVVNSLNKPTGLQKWKGNGWRNYAGKPVSNQKLWFVIDMYLRYFGGNIGKRAKIEFKHVDGHNGEKFNELCDSLAQIACHGKEVNKRKTKNV